MRGKRKQAEHPKTINKSWLRKLACGAIRETIEAHGSITKPLVGSAAKRVAGRIYGELLARESQ